MTKHYLMLFFGLILGVSLSAKGATRTTDKSDWLRMEIRLSPEGTLKDLFDSGLRPFRHPSLESNILEAKHIKAIVVQPDGFKLPEYEAETIDISVYGDGTVCQIEFGKASSTFEECRSEMMRWIHLGQRPKRTEKELDEYLAAAKADPMNFSDLGKGFTHDFSISWRDEHQIAYTIWFLNCANAEKPFAVSMTIGFPIRPRPSFYSSPIPPPPGYEHVDMTAPKDFGPDSEPIPSMEGWKMPDYSNYPKMDIRSNIVPPGHTTKPPLAERRRSRAVAVLPPVISKPSFSVLVWILGLLGILVAALLVQSVRIRRK
jgi:hypothetical protein